MMVAKEIIEKLQIKEEILNIYLIGSRVYGTAKEISDYDFIIVSEDVKNEKDGNLEFLYHFKGLWNMDITIYTLKTFQNYLNLFEHHAIECVSYNYNKETKKFVILEKYPLQIPKIRDPYKVRVKFHDHINQCWIKFKKKIINDKNLEVGKKCLLHSIRVGLFGIQLLKYGYIQDFTVGNMYFNDIIVNKVPENSEIHDYNEKEIFKLYEKKYKSLINSIESEIRKLAPK